ncbi:dihydrofolate reductase family protein [Neoasaia chiangmaiensis]|uniref:Bacterial bifunctional deaminase-reductase C-terminal domain-containing protein n=1 Tax=Neoasaia chiangmaiensis TaxID=320497 RepID=A0A1U9KLF0_9PROT|nr:dihydrofolate reductase family protein [Neoasaia chiangmaiensis]AQS86621.1 hypothetical protein A0U93_00140 [Neoasaia chiangmaiensis]
MRPRIICHMITSIDGRLRTRRWTAPCAGTNRHVLMGYYEQIALRHDAPAWIVGRHTMSEILGSSPWPTDRQITEQVWPRTPFIGDRRERNLAVVVDLHGRLTYTDDDIDGDHATAILGEEVSNSYLSHLRAVGVSYLFVGSGEEMLAVAMQGLYEHFGVERLLLEGGGITNGEFLRAGLIDELSLLVYPGLDGLSGEPSIFDYPGNSEEQPALGQSLALISSETLEGGVMWLRYRVERSTKAG